MKEGVENLNSKKIGEKLKDLRGDKTLEEVSKALKISKSALCMYESGQRVPKDEIKIRIAKYFGLTVESIFYT